MQIESQANFDVSLRMCHFLSLAKGIWWKIEMVNYWLNYFTGALLNGKSIFILICLFITPQGWASVSLPGAGISGLH